MKSAFRIFRKSLVRAAAAVALMGTLSAQAMELNWSGQFWSEYHLVSNYSLNSADNGGTFDPARATAGGYYIPAGGTSTASFETLFLRLRPSLIVNDNITIKSEWWAGDPIFGLFGAAYPAAPDRRQYYSSQSRGSAITAQRFWGEFLSDFGTLQVGRIPLNWGLGLFWNGGDDLFNRYQSTGDSIRLISKFGAFTFAPAYVRYSLGNALGGSCSFDNTGTCIPGQQGGSGVSDYSLMLRYENLEDDFEGGVNFVRRLSGRNQDGSGQLGPEGTPVQANFNTWDVFARKRMGSVTLAAEIPITSGTVGGADYSTVAFAAEGDWKVNDAWSLGIKGGYAPGQSNSAERTISKYKAYFFNPNYQVGQIMFNYQLANFAGYPGGNNPNTAANPAALASPFDNPIVNAAYLAGSGAFKTDKWTLHGGVVWANAIKSAATGQYFFNTWQKRMSGTVAAGDQGKSLGFEVNTGASFQWDEYFLMKLDLAAFFPGSYYKFSNTGTENSTATVLGAVARIGVNF